MGFQVTAKRLCHLTMMVFRVIMFTIIRQVGCGQCHRESIQCERRGGLIKEGLPRCSLCLFPNLRLNQDRHNCDSRYAVLSERVSALAVVVFEKHG